jgi:polyisoprenyl-phosphate glycosyltransferase
MTPSRHNAAISFVLPVHDEACGLRAFHAELTRATDKRPDHSFEFVYVNDGSRDSSLELLRQLGLADPRVRVLDLSRNFGHQIAITAGIDHADGDAVIMMDTDLQDPPEVALKLITAWEEGADIVYAQRRSRRDSPFKRFTAWLYYALLHVFAEVDIPRNTGDFRLMDRRAADALRQHRERNRFVRGIVASLGFTQVGVPFDRDERSAGTTSYPLAKMLRLAADGITSFSAAPLRMITRLGALSVGLSLSGIIYAVTQKVFWPETTVPGWTWLAVVVLFMGGVQMLSLGVIGSYVGRIYAEVQNRPLYLLRDDVPLPDAPRSGPRWERHAAPTARRADAADVLTHRPSPAHPINR